ncbi:KIN14S [Symbiodinium microadriaticum]|nr:KIN14S [Symbiodinium microadriaticum]CAE7942760.1 KIN14S [Symbiodinium sp. KB8]
MHACISTQLLIPAKLLFPALSPGEDISEVFALTEKKSVTVKDPLSRGRMEHNFTFDHVFAPEDGQEAVFDVVAKPLVDNLLNGFNSCCFAYGQTGSLVLSEIFSWLTMGGGLNKSAC